MEDSVDIDRVAVLIDMPQRVAAHPLLSYTMYSAESMTAQVPYEFRVT